MTKQPVTYAIVTPAHNEAHFLPAVIASLTAQTIPPTAWVIVNDRSTDHTAEILDREARKKGFIKVVHRSGKGDHVLGSHVSEVVKEGLHYVPPQMDYIVKMDADLVLPEDYFEQIFKLFQDDSRLGIAAGKMYTQYRRRWIMERYPDFHVPGLCKTYRKACFDQIGGLYSLYGWDILDCTKARMLGWTTASFSKLAIRHLRMMGSKGGMPKGHIGHGRGMWATNAHPLFVLGRALYRSLEPPYLTGLFIILGYVIARRRGEPQLQDRALVHYLRKEQLSRLMGRKLKEESLRIKSL
ncbi:glycosyltransferase family 2 protein [Desulfosarcina ovata]|uniref:Glycosyltransferase 2-like domain-containing protein n=1 Tax=Desulfosarcina ovata subsp. ovata TaxID=2752305 RepID=A0A5K8A5Q3_9BACT|nr:glycosyltransferase family 2 protein [Desulfosarcina ovata]BBO87718.1 hypothetical protein DSCOOX_08980 [Desulfosarcina ovata subsp. ovata]